MLLHDAGDLCHSSPMLISQILPFFLPFPLSLFFSSPPSLFPPLSHPPLSIPPFPALPPFPFSNHLTSALQRPSEYQSLARDFLRRPFQPDSNFQTHYEDDVKKIEVSECRCVGRDECGFGLEKGFRGERGLEEKRGGWGGEGEVVRGMREGG